MSWRVALEILGLAGRGDPNHLSKFCWYLFAPFFFFWRFRQLSHLTCKHVGKVQREQRIF